MSATSSLPLEELLDVSNLHTQSQISRRFFEIARSIFFSHFLRVEYEGTSTDFEILEIEFYLRKEGLHEDPFCHAHHDQSRSAQWYFHRAPTRAVNAPVAGIPTDAGGYRGGSRKGLDLTFGTSVTSPFFPVLQHASQQVSGGILLRSMRSRDEFGVIVSGPSLLVDKILGITHSRNISELVNTKLGGCISALSPTNERALNRPARLYLAACSGQPNTHAPTIHRSPRIGLDLSHSSVSSQRNNDRVHFISKLYRHFIHPELLKSNGRCHTFIGILLEQHSESTTNESLHCPTLRGELTKLTTLRPVTIEKYIEDYIQGLTKRSLSEYVGSAGKGASSNPQMFLRMMGVLRRMGLLATNDEGSITGP